MAYHTVMRRRPWPLITLALLHFIAPLGNIVVNALLMKKEVVSYFVNALSPHYFSLNWPIIVAPLVAGYAIYACQKWSFYVYLASLTSLFIFSYTGYMSKANSISLWAVLLIYFVNVAVVAYFLLPAVRNIYFDRRLRWWEIQARYRSFYKCKWKPAGSAQDWSGVIGNFSENGLFLQAADLPEDKQKIEISIPFNSETILHFVGESIIHNRADALGFGVKFEHTRESLKAAKKIVEDLEAQGMRINNLMDRPEDTFSYWFRTLVTTGKGLLPKKEK